jgi:hypothetical protein
MEKIQDQEEKKEPRKCPCCREVKVFEDEICEACLSDVMN